MRKSIALATLLMTLAACGSAASTSSTTAAARPSSPVKITIVSPTNGEVVHGNSVNVVVSITGGEIVKDTTTHITPTQGHVHLYLQGQLIFMAYALSQAVPVQPGVTYSLHAEFVAADHGPYSPRDVTPTVFFSAAP